jgi:hypothetical protein
VRSKLKVDLKRKDMNTNKFINVSPTRQLERNNNISPYKPEMKNEKEEKVDKYLIAKKVAASSKSSKIKSTSYTEK